MSRENGWEIWTTLSSVISLNLCVNKSKHSSLISVQFEKNSMRSIGTVYGSSIRTVFGFFRKGDSSSVEANGEHIFTILHFYPPSFSSIIATENYTRFLTSSAIDNRSKPSLSMIYLSSCLNGASSSCMLSIICSESFLSPSRPAVNRIVP